MLLPFVFSLSTDQYGVSYNSFVLDDVQCIGNESALINCDLKFDPENCELGKEEASVQCSGIDD